MKAERLKETRKGIREKGERELRIAEFSVHKSHLHLLLLLAWMAIAAGLRFKGLDSKPPWTDEFSTMVFSLGHSFRSVPLDKAITIEELLQPLQLTPSQTGLFPSIQNVIHHLLSESNHPPVYFVLANLWMQLFPAATGEYVSLWVTRSLPAFLGVASIPAMFGFGWLAFRSRLAGQLAAAMMAVSPYAIYMAQEARHYALAILLVIASLSCFVIATREIKQRSPLQIRIAFIWVIVNCIGIAVHYFFTLTLCAEAMVLIAMGIKTEGKNKFLTSNFLFLTFNSHWWRIWAVAAGTLVGGLVWLPVWQSSRGRQLTEWIYSSDRLGLEWVKPIFQALGNWIAMISLLPVESSDLLVVIASGLAMLFFFIWALPILWSALKTQLTEANREETFVLGGFVLSAIAIFFFLTYCFGIDLTRGARYNFAYFPAVIVLLGSCLSVIWNWEKSHPPTREGKISPPSLVGKDAGGLGFLFWLKLVAFRISGKKAVVLIWLMGFVSAITVVENLGYQKYYRPDLLISIIQQTSTISQIPNPQISQSPILKLIATNHKTHVQTGEMMGLAWEFKRLYPTVDATAAPQFLLAHQLSESASHTLRDSLRDSYSAYAHGYEENASRTLDIPNSAAATLKTTLEQLPPPIDLWLVNFDAPVEVLNTQKCFYVKTPSETFLESWPMVDGYDYQLYRCQGDR